MTRILITPPKRFDLPSVHELWEAREVFWRFGTRDVLLRYRQTVIGIAWVIIQPLAAAGIFSIVFGSVAKLPSSGMPYFVFSFAGLLGWNLASSIISRAAPSLVSNQALVSKVFFPRLLVPLSAALSSLLDFAVALGLMIVLLFVYGIHPGWQVLLLPVWVALTLLLSMGVGVAAAALTVPYRDVNYVLPWVVQIGMYITPVAYAVSAVPAGTRWAFEINPFSWLMESYRWSLLGLDAPQPWQVAALVAVSLVVFFGGTLLFQRFERGFADVI